VRASASDSSDGDALQASLLEDFAVEHTTFQLEPMAHEGHEVGGHG